MDDYLDRRAVVLGLVTAALGTALRPGPAAATSGAIREQPWAVWDKNDKPVRGGYFRIATEQYIGKMNPNRWPVLDWVSMSYFHERLMMTDGRYVASAPWLAEEIRLEDPRTILMRLRDGVTFHDGSKLDAASLKYQIDWVRDSKSKTFTAGWLAPLASLEIVDERILRWKSNEPWAAFTGVMSTAPGFVLSSEALRADADKYDTQPYGTGPYMLEEASPGNFLKLKRNPNWWFAKASGHPDMPYFDGIHVSVIPDAQVRLANLRAGKIDSLLLEKSQYAALRDDPTVNLYRFPGPHLAALRFNTTRGVFQDIRLRKAVSHAIDRKALVAGVLFGVGRVASCLYPEDHWCHNPELKPVAYDPDLSRKLLAEAGYASGLTIKGYYSNASYFPTVAEAIKSMLGKVGINWQVDLLPPAQLVARGQSLDYDLGSGNWVFIFDPDGPASGFYHPSGAFSYGRRNNPEVIALIEAGRREVDFDKRKQIYWKLEKMLYDDYEDAWLWWDETVTAYRKQVQGWHHDGFLKYRDVWFWSHPLWFKDGKP